MAYDLDIEQENKEIVRQYRHLLRSAKPILKQGDTRIIKQAFHTALEAHKEMRRKSGEPYIFHPIAVAQICVEEIGLGTTSIVAALLHDVVEDTDTTLEDIERSFGKKVARIIDGLTKISGGFEFGTSQQAENFRKIVFTLSEDVRVILVKLADRLHNMRTMESMPRHKQLKISSETIYMYAPLAHRLGLYSIKTELEDLYLRYTDPETYKEIEEKIRQSEPERKRFIRNFIKPIQEQLKDRYFEFTIKGRTKSIYSIWNKMKKQEVPFEQVYDLFAIRIIINSSPENEKSLSWQVYSIVTDYYMPNPDRLRDWISTPKANGYESLHTTVMGEEGRWVEVQIRTNRMDDIAEKGYAAHWKYKDHKPEDKDAGVGESGLDAWIERVRDLLHHNKQEPTSAEEFVDEFRSNFYDEEIFVFTPKGEMRVLPQGATAIDFAFDIHTQIGLHCLGAKVNHQLVPVTHKLKNGDQVEIITSNKQAPKEAWANKVVTSKARRRIREYLNEGRRHVVAKGQELVERKFQQMDLKWSSATAKKLVVHFGLRDREELLFDIGKGVIPLKSLEVMQSQDFNQQIEDIQANLPNSDELKTQVKELNKSALMIGDNDEVDYSLATCCNPIPGDDVFGYVTLDGGVKVHRTTCPNATEMLSNHGYRVVKAHWREHIRDAFLTTVRLVGTDRKGLVLDIAKVMTEELDINIRGMKVDTKNDLIEDYLTFHVTDTEHLQTVMNALRNISEVISVERSEP